MNTIGFIVAWFAGLSTGLAVMGRYPAGLDTASGWWLILASLLMVVPALLARNDKLALWCCLWAGAALAGCGRAMLIHPPESLETLAYYNRSANGPAVQISGSIADQPVYGDTWQRVKVDVEQILMSGEPAPRNVSGALLALLPRYPELATGERLSLSGRLTAPPELSSFDYAAYLARQGIYSYMGYPRLTRLGPPGDTGLGKLVEDSRRSIREAIEKSLPEPEASLAVGVVMGDRTSMPRDLQDAFLRSGTTHILAISGQNIALIVGCTQ